MNLLQRQKPLTAMQVNLYTFLSEFFNENDQLPPISAICKYFKWSSSNAAMTGLYQLQARGLIEKNAVGKYRFVR